MDVDWRPCDDSVDVRGGQSVPRRRCLFFHSPSSSGGTTTRSGRDADGWRFTERKVDVEMVRNVSARLAWWIRAPTTHDDRRTGTAWTALRLRHVLWFVLAVAFAALMLCLPDRARVTGSDVIALVIRPGTSRRGRLPDRRSNMATATCHHGRPRAQWRCRPFCALATVAVFTAVLAAIPAMYPRVTARYDGRCCALVVWLPAQAPGRRAEIGFRGVLWWCTASRWPAPVAVIFNGVCCSACGIRSTRAGGQYLLFVCSAVGLVTWRSRALGRFVLAALDHRDARARGGVNIAVLAVWGSSLDVAAMTLAMWSLYYHWRARDPGVSQTGCRQSTVRP